jgi:hypothetical protein
MLLYDVLYRKLGASLMTAVVKLLLLDYTVVVPPTAPAGAF